MSRTDDESVATLDPEAHTRERSPRLNFAVVGIGASAGGLQALQRFFGEVPSRCGIAFVVVMHLSPRHESHAAEILQRCTGMPVQKVVEPTPIREDHVYVVPPGRDLTMEDGHLCLSGQQRVGGRHTSIDVFFRTLAEVHRERAAAIVLSGTGSDGSVGITRIRECGGLTFVQSPDDADSDGMPRAAIATNSIDFVLPVVEIVHRLLELTGNARAIRLPALDDGSAVTPSVDPSEEAAAALEEVKRLVREQTGHDFAPYKRATILRRVERRLQVNALKSLPEYRDFLVSHPAEIGALLQDLLISVTNFFRDREAFEVLEREVIPDLAKRRAPDEPVRVWVAGCASGEEAYSIAMQLQDWADLDGNPIDFQVFATDVDERALTVARRGVFPRAIVVDVSAQRLRKYFIREEGQYHVTKALRDRVLFARHNLLQDPPFSHLDLICCRNVLTYFGRDAQKQVLQAFRFALRPTGHLFLGAAESTEFAPGLFSVVDRRHRLYEVDASRPAQRPIARRIGRDVPVLDLSRRTVSDPRPAIDGTAMLDEATVLHGAASVLIDDARRVLQWSAGASRFLQNLSTLLHSDLADAVQPALRNELQAALLRMTRTDKSVRGAVILSRDHRDVHVNITVRPFQAVGRSDRLAVVTFDEAEDVLREVRGGMDGKTGIRDRLDGGSRQPERELIEDLERAEHSSEELQSFNEELQAINEELRTVTEELGTGREEMQSINEELLTVNDELNAKIEEAVKVNDDLRNLIASTDIATIFVDNGLRIKRYTPRALDYFNLIPADIGRPLLDIRHRLRFEQLASDADEAFLSLRTIEREIESDTGGRLLARVLPYRTTADVIDGATITFVDVTALRQAEARVQESEARLSLVAATTRDFAIMTMDDTGLITTWNKGAERMFGYSEAEIIGRPSAILFTPEDRAALVPENEIDTARTKGRAEDDRWHLRKDDTRLFCSGVVAPFQSGERKGLARIARDVTDMRREQTAREAMLLEERAARSRFELSSKLKDDFLAVMSHELKHPLNLIHINAELLTRIPQVRDVPPVQRAAQVIRKTVIAQGKIIDDLLDLSRVRTGKLTLHMAPVDLDETIGNIVAAMRPDAEPRNIAFDYRADPDLGTVECDPLRIEQIAWNLLSNAFKFTPDGGRIDVELARDRDHAKITVSDSGRGISADFLPHVFDMFDQEVGGTARTEGGLGIGLALVRELALAHGGRAEAESAGRDQGARFSVWIPVHDATRRDEPRQDDQPLRSVSGLRVLVVEDSRDALEPFVELLRLVGAEPTAALDGRQALALLDEKDFDLIISDVSMPDIGGYDFIKAVRQHARSARVPAIALTGHGRVRDRKMAIEAGFDAHVTKPASIRDIERALGASDVKAPGRPPDRDDD